MSRTEKGPLTVMISLAVWTLTVIMMLAMETARLPLAAQSVAWSSVGDPSSALVLLHAVMLSAIASGPSFRKRSKFSDGMGGFSLLRQAGS